jgi:hypothetical protein
MCYICGAKLEGAWGGHFGYVRSPPSILVRDVDAQVHRNAREGKCPQYSDTVKFNNQNIREGAMEAWNKYLEEVRLLSSVDK